MSVKSILGSLFNFSLNGEVDAARTVGREHGTELAEAYLDGLRGGVLDTLSEGRRALLGLPEPVEVIEAEAKVGKALRAKGAKK